MDFLSIILYSFLILIIMKIVRKILDNIETMLIRDIRKNKLRYGVVISRKDLAAVAPSVKIKNRVLYNLAFSNSFFMQCIPYRYIFDDTSSQEEDEFLHWCKKFLLDLGYTHIRFENNSVKTSKDITCEKDGEVVHVQSRLLKLEENTPASKEDHWPKLGRPDIQKLAGAMERDQVKRGVIITTGDFTSDAREYAKSMPEPYCIKLIDGCEITKTVRKLRERVVLKKERGY